jgi:hypothetical protein
MRLFSLFPWAELAAGSIAFAVYAVTLAPSVPAGDSGELITVAATGGVAHPPGYPLYTILGRAWLGVVPFGSAALRMNLFSAVCAALAVAVLAGAVRRLAGSRMAAAIAAALLAFSPPFWKNAVVAEVFALNALLAACLIDAFARVLRRAGTVDLPGGDEQRPPGPAWPLLSIAFIAGLLATHHHSLVLLALPIALVTAAALWLPGPFLQRAGIAHRPYVPTPALVAGCVLAFALGLLPLAWIPFAAARNPALSWGDVHGARDLLRLLLRADYGTFQLDPVAADYAPGVPHGLFYLQSLARDFGWTGLLLLAPGVFAFARRPPLLAAAIGFAFLQWAFFTRVRFPADTPLLRGVVERFYVLPDLGLAVVCGLGAAALLGRLPPRAQVPLGALLLAVVTAVPLVAHGERISQRGNRLVEHLARDVMAGVPRGAVLFVRGDVFHNSLAWLQHCERVRPDVTVVDQELMTYDWYVRALRRRMPDLLPRLDRAERLVLEGGRVIEGRILESGADTVRVLGAGAYHAVPRAAIARIEHPDPAGMFLEAKRVFRASWLLPSADDRYTGLPGSVNLLWIDHLIGSRPVAFLGFKEDSWTRRYEMVPSGYVQVAYPRGAAPAVRQRAAQALHLLSAFHLDDVFSIHDAWSFEAIERARIAGFVEQAAVLLTQRETATMGADHPGLARLRALVERVEAEPAPEPALLRAASVLRLFHPSLHDRAKARSNLMRWLASGASGPLADEARRWLEKQPAP